MNRRFFALALSAVVVSSGLVAPSFAGETTAGEVAVHTLTLPFRLVTGATTGVFGFFKGGAEESYDMSAEANESVKEAGATPGQALVLPFTIPVGFVKGGFQGFSDYFPKGYTVWDAE